MSIEEARQHLVSEIDKRLHISRLTNGFYEKSSDILMKSAFGFLMDQWISAGLLPQDFRGEEDSKKKEKEEEEKEDPKKKKVVKDDQEPSSSRKQPQGKIRGLVNKFDKKQAEQDKKLKEFEEKFTKDSGHDSPTSSEPGSAPPEMNIPDEDLDEQEQILNDIDLEDLFDEEAFENQCDADKQLVKVEDDSEKQVVKVEDDAEKEIIPVDEIEESERQAQILKEQAQVALNENAVEFQEAYKLQQEALVAAHDANVKTAKALVNQEIGTQLLAEAGAEMIEAGAHLQREALASERQVPVNIHQEATITQGITVSEANQEAAAHAHEQVTFKQVEQVSQTEQMEQVPIHY